jgi:invasion protein IalB
VVVEIVVMTSFRIPAAFAAALLVAPIAFAAPAPKPAQDQQAQSNKQPEGKEYGSWIVRCETGKSQAPCQMAQVRFVEKTKQRVLGVWMVYIPAQDANYMEIAVPLGVELQNGLILNSDTYKSGVLKFTRCDGGGCYVEGTVGKDILDSLARATKAQVQVIMVNGKRYEFVLEMNGFNEAHRALVELTKQKGGGAAAPAAPAQQ